MREKRFLFFKNLEKISFPFLKKQRRKRRRNKFNEQKNKAIHLNHLVFHIEENFASS